MYSVEQGHHLLAAYLLSIGSDVNYHCQMFYPIMACFNKPYLPPDNVSYLWYLFERKHIPD